MFMLKEPAETKPKCRYFPFLMWENLVIWMGKAANCPRLTQRQRSARMRRVRPSPSSQESRKQSVSLPLVRETQRRSFKSAREDYNTR
jgi:hypothetical protein